jgi:hypothetical protein
MRSHEDLMLDWFESKKLYSSGAVEGMKRRINLVTRESCRQGKYELFKITLFHELGRHPEPERTHRF